MAQLPSLDADGSAKSLARAERTLARLQSDRPTNCPAAYDIGLVEMGKVVAELARAVRTGEALANDHKRVVRGLQVSSSSNQPNESLLRAACMPHFHYPLLVPMAHA